MPAPPRKTSPKKTGPVTLEQARAMVAVTSKAPRRRSVTIQTATPESVGIERKRLEIKQRQERKQRIDEYTAMMKIMKRRGVKNLTRKSRKPGRARARAGAAARGAGKPLQVFAEGDSWFEYPVPLFGGGIIKRLEKRIGVPILNLAKAGDEVRFMLGVEERKLLIKQLADGSPAGGSWDAVLFSGGGNDIVDNPMALWIRDFDSSRPPAGQINQARLDAALFLIRAGYEDLIALRDELSPSTHLIFHAYDFPIPDGRGKCHFGPWLKPTFDLRKFPSLDSRVAVMKVMLQQFAALLQSLQAAHTKVSFINGQGTLAPEADAWDNELHPESDGFNAFADLFHARLKALFPGRVL